MLSHEECCDANCNVNRGQFRLKGKGRTPLKEHGPETWVNSEGQEREAQEKVEVTVSLLCSQKLENIGWGCTVRPSTHF